jgi:hypothetical protein
VFGKLWVDDLGVYYPINFDLNQPCYCVRCCTVEQGDGEDTGDGAIALYAGERQIQATDLSIPGCGIDFAISRRYRSQASPLRSVASNDFGVDWAMSYIDDRLILDGHNVIVYRPTLRTDVFINAGRPGKFIAPMEFYEQLTLNKQRNFELRVKCKA